MIEKLKDVSIIIATQPGDEQYTGLLQNLSNLKAPSEVIVLICGQLSDEEAERRTRDLAKQYSHLDLKVHYAASGNRGQQLNQGARLSEKTFLWFLPPQARLDETSFDVLQHLSLTTGVLYYCDVVTSASKRVLQARLWMTNFLTSLFEIPVYEQGLLIDRSSFRKLGEFSQKRLPLEDLEFSRKASRLGLNLEHIALPLHLDKTPQREFRPMC